MSDLHTTRRLGRSALADLVIGLVIFSLGAGATIVAASLPGGQASQRPGQPSRASAQTPARDQSLQQGQRIGTASITGQIVAADTGRPLKRVRVTAVSNALQGMRAARTDDQGRYALAGLPAGEYLVSASRDGFLSGNFGQRRALRMGRPVAVADGQAVRDIDIALQRGGVISGHLFDEDGEPILRASVRALRVAWTQAGRRLATSGSAQTDDRGYFRVFGLVPGTYYVSAYSNAVTAPVFAMARGGVMRTDSTDGDEPPVGYAPTYFPGTPNPGEASPVTVTAQQEVSEINFALYLVPTTRVVGTVVNADGSPLAGASVTLVSEEGNSDWAQPLSGGVRSDGSFSILNVPPGRYLAAARGRAGARQEGTLYGAQSVAVSGREVSVNLTLARGTQVTGALVFESSIGTPGEAFQVRIGLVPMDQRMGIPPSTFRPQAGGTFALTDVHPGSYLVSVSGFSSRWALKGAYIGGRDAADVPFEVKGQQPLSGLQIVLTDAPNEISGTVVDGDGAPALDCVVLAFSTDPSLWRPSSRTLRLARPGQDGGYRIRALPPGDYYLIAVDDVDSTGIYDPAVLNALRPAASRVTLSEGEPQTRTLKVVASGQSF